MLNGKIAVLKFHRKVLKNAKESSWANFCGRYTEEQRRKKKQSETQSIGREQSKTTVILQFHQISMALQQGEKSRERIVTQRIVRQIEFSQIGEVP